MTDYGVVPTGFIPKTYDEVLESLMENARQKFGYDMDLSVGTILGQKIRTFAVEIAAHWQALEGAYYSAYVSSAEGQSLDRVVAAVGLARGSPTPATGAVTFSIAEAASSDIEIPSGTVVGLSDESILFETSESGTLVAGETSVTIPIVAQEAGSSGNASGGTITLIVSSLPGIETISNEAALTGGGDTETDTELRIRAMTHRPVARGTKLALESALLALDGVSDVSIVEDTDAHTATAYVSGGTGTEISAAIEETRPCGIAVSWDYATPLPINVTVTVVGVAGISGSVVEDQVDSAISGWLGERGIGEDLSYYDLLLAIAACSYVSNVSSLSFTDGVTPVSTIGGSLAVAANKKPASGTIQVTVS